MKIRYFEGHISTFCPANTLKTESIVHWTVACSRLSVNGGDRKSGRRRAGSGIERREGTTSLLSVPDPARRLATFSIAPIDREPGTG